MAEIIDFHTHFLPRLYAQALKKHIPGDPDGWPTPGWDEHLTLAFMKKNHIGYSILSLSSPHFNFGDKEETIAIARDANDTGERVTQDHPDQLGYFASLPLPYAQESVSEIDVALAHSALGFTVPTNSRGLYFGTPIFDPVYAKLNQEKAIVLMHPNRPEQGPINVNIDIQIPLMGFFIDTTMTFMNLLRYHFFDRYPDIKLIVPHAGAFLSILADRDAAFVKQQYNSDMFAALRHVYFDVAGTVFPRQLPMLLTLADEQHLVFGSDIPYTPPLLASQMIKLFNEREYHDKMSRRVSRLQRFDGFFNHFKKLRPLPTVLKMSSNMLTGAEILSPEMAQDILVNNGKRLLELS